MSDAQTSPDATQRPNARQDAEDEISLLELVNVRLRRWRLVVGLPVGAAFLTAVVSLLIPPTYTTSTSFVPEVAQGRRVPASLAGLAGQFGISVVLRQASHRASMPRS